MASLKKCIVLFLSILLVVSSDFHRKVSGLRILEGEQWLKQTTDLIIQSLPRGSVPSSGASPCTNIPGGKRRGRCALERNNIKEEKNIISAQIDNIQSPPPSSSSLAYPNNMVQFGTANSENNNTQNQG
ncbi:hypothetical protein HAX54_029272 [Datura stramonium]|uniref:Uncharacterized protein n=1 Tax=Datura stramonium TaxID=4076 RepID=A0ABS8V8G3_DATST|nr:hypothetical protein [Datura stramonium]